MRSIFVGLAAGALSFSTATAVFAVTLPPAGDAVNPYALADVDPAAPFGAIDIVLAGATANTVQTWATTLTNEQKLELTNRCQVIDLNAANYQATVTAFCGMWMTAMSNDPGATPVPGLGGAYPMTPVPKPAR